MITRNGERAVSKPNTHRIVEVIIKIYGRKEKTWISGW